MTNHRDTEVVRFVWPDHPQLRFSPQIGHLLSKSTKDMSVTFRTDRPVSLKTLELKCKVTKIILEQAMFDGLDWDDRLKTVKWIEVPRTSPPSSDGLALQCLNCNSWSIIFILVILNTVKMYIL